MLGGSGCSLSIADTYSGHGEDESQLFLIETYLLTVFIYTLVLEHTEVERKHF